MPDRLKVTNPKHFPVQAFFNAIGDMLFLESLNNIAQGIGLSLEDAVVCIFPDDPDPDDEPFEGIRFKFFEEHVDLTQDELVHYLDEVIKEHLTRHPQDKDKIDAILQGRKW